MRSGATAEFFIDHDDKNLLELIQNNRLALVNGTGSGYTADSKASNPSCKLVFVEDKFGVNLQAGHVVICKKMLKL